MVSGTTATNPDAPGTGLVCPGDAAGQAAYIFVVISLALQEAGSSMEHVTRTRMYVTNPADMDAVMAEHARVFRNVRPASTIVVVRRNPTPALNDCGVRVRVRVMFMFMFRVRVSVPAAHVLLLVSLLGFRSACVALCYLSKPPNVALFLHL
ncbi:unnamed protein product [Discosporangium mesarthrocarpum]